MGLGRRLLEYTTMPVRDALPGRLAFTLPETTRVVWADPRARAVWEPRVARIVAAWQAIEVGSVVDDVRPSALQTLAPEALADRTAAVAAHGLTVVPLDREQAVGRYTAAAAPVVEGQPWDYRVAITRPELAFVWQRAWGQRDDETIGILLGYPPCCRAFFREVWVAGQHVDTTWHMAHGATAVSGPTVCNILLRWLGVRLVPHLPCGFACAASAELGAALVGVAARRGYVDELSWAQAMLEWPTRWSALHGYAQITTPVCRVVTRTDATAHELRVDRAGSLWPAEGAHGIAFPFRPPPSRALTTTAAYQTAFIPLTTLRQDWMRNGFASEKAMRAAHRVVLDAVAVVAPASLLDLGAGSGALLRRAQDELGIGAILGIEADAARAGSVPWLRVGDLFDVAWADRRYDVVLVMPGRLVERPGDAPALRAALRQSARVVVAYAYGDWLTRPGGLLALCEAAGLLDDWTATITRSGPDAQAVVLVPKPGEPT
jgi:hypothetical protein